MGLVLSNTAQWRGLGPGTLHRNLGGEYPMRDTAMVAINSQLRTRHGVDSSKGAVGDASRPLKALTSEGNLTLHPPTENY